MYLPSDRQEYWLQCTLWLNTDNDVITSRFTNYFHSHEPYNNHTRQNDRPISRLYLAHDDDVFKTRSPDQHLQPYPLSYNTGNNQNSQKTRSACTDLILQVTMTPLQKGSVTSVYGLISFFIRSITTRLGRMVDQHALITH